jgi:hypothetical protein
MGNEQTSSQSECTNTILDPTSYCMGCNFVDLNKCTKVQLQKTRLACGGVFRANTVVTMVIQENRSSLNSHDVRHQGASPYSIESRLSEWEERLGIL